jgi:hypothetical protein
MVQYFVKHRVVFTFYLLQSMGMAFPNHDTRSLMSAVLNLVASSETRIFLLSRNLSLLDMKELNR